MNLITCLVAIFCMQGSAFAADEMPLDSVDIELGSGKTYTISSLQELYNFADIMKNASYELFEGVTVKLTADIVVNDGVFGGSASVLSSTLPPSNWYNSSIASFTVILLEALSMLSMSNTLFLVITKKFLNLF